MVKTSFRFWAILMFICLILLTGVLFVVVITWLLETKTDLPPVVFFSIGFFILTWVWLFFGEIRTKATVVVVEEDYLIVKGFMGFGPKKEIEFIEFQGYKTSLLPSRNGYYEYLYLIKNGKKAVKVSQFYHDNYSEIKKVLTQKPLCEVSRLCSNM